MVCFYAKAWCEALFVLRLSNPWDKPLEWMVTRHCTMGNHPNDKRELKDKPSTDPVRQALPENVKVTLLTSQPRRCSNQGRLVPI